MKGSRKHTGAFLLLHPALQLVQLLSRVRLFATPWTAARQASLSITNSQSLLRLVSIKSVMPSNHLMCCPLLLLPSIFPSIKVFPNESVLNIRWPKYWSFSFNISPSNEYSGVISFRMDWLDLLAVQGTLKSLLQHHSSKASVLSALRRWPNLYPFQSHSCFYYYHWSWLSSQGCVGLCCTAAWISCKCAHIPSLLGPPPCPTPRGHHRAPGWAPCVTQRLPTSCLFCTWSRV